jgi:hypothetical protein
VAYKELATFPSEWEVWKRLLQNVVSFQMWKNVIQVFKFQVLSVWKRVLQVLENFKIKV